jgi:hypothetical protein
VKLTSGHHQLQKDFSNVLSGMFIAIMAATENKLQLPQQL